MAALESTSRLIPLRRELLFISYYFEMMTVFALPLRRVSSAMGSHRNECPVEDQKAKYSSTCTT